MRDFQRASTPYSAEDLPPATPAVFHILLALVSGASHGYGIMQEVERLTGGRVKLGNATLYRSLQKMAVDGMVEEFSDAAAATDERRREYRLTAFGLRTARAEAQRHRLLVQVSGALGLLANSSKSRSRKQAEGHRR
jgi:DNA-binding PadR family transcriptional regulator